MSESYKILNSLIDIDIYATELKEKNITTIPDILFYLYAEEIYDDIHDKKKIPNSWWHEVMKFNNNVIIANDLTPLEYNDALYNCRKSMEKGEYSFHFKKCGNHYNTCVCIICILQKNLSSDFFLDFFCKITGEKITTLLDFTASLYEKGHFLTTHHDIEKIGKYAFVFSFNKNWNPSYGGLLNFYDKNKIYNVCIPSFNTLTIFKLPVENPNFHFVSEVVSLKQRYSFVGWLG